MSNLNYQTTEHYDSDMINIGRDNSGLVINALKITSGTPANVADEYYPAAIVQNVSDATVWYNSGTTASPSFVRLATAGSGITSLNGLITVNQVFSNDVNIEIVSTGATHVITWNGILATNRGGTGLSSFNANGVMYASSTSVLTTLPIGTNGQVLTVVGGAIAWATTATVPTKTRQLYDDTTGASISLSNTPSFIYAVNRNGLAQRQGATRDYTISGTTITFNTSLVTENVEVVYEY